MHAVARTDDFAKSWRLKVNKKESGIKCFPTKKPVNLPNVLSFHVVYLSIKFNI